MNSLKTHQLITAQQFAKNKLRTEQWRAVKRQCVRRTRSTADAALRFATIWNWAGIVNPETSMAFTVSEITEYVFSTK